MMKSEDWSLQEKKQKLFFPVFVDLTEKTILVAGGGAVATRRIRTLLPFVQRITAIAPEFSEELEELAAREKTLALLQRPIEDRDLEQLKPDLVLAATSQPERNAELQQLCRKKGIPVNVSTDQKLCDFQFPSVLMEDGAVIGINASGRDHRKVRSLRERIEAFLRRNA